jgi:preprotein translocase subunit SecD
MSKKNTVLSLVFVFILAAAAGFFCFPGYLNQGIEWFNQTTKLSVYKVPESEFRMGLDLKGGVRLEYQADLSKIEQGEKPAAMEGLRDVIERRINIFGVAEPQITVSGGDRLVVEIPGEQDIEKAKEWIGQTPWLEFWEEKDQAEIEKINAKMKEIQDSGAATLEDIQKITDWQIAFESPYKATELNSSYFKKAGLAFDQNNNPIIEIEFNGDGAKIFEDVTGRNVDKTLAILLDGQSIVDTTGDGKIDGSDMYAPHVDEKISSGKAQISGEKDIAVVKTLVSRLNQGALPVQIGQPVSENKIGPTLGKVSLDDTLKAGLFGFLLIVIFMVLYYRLPGLLASLSLVLYLFLLLAIFKLISVTLTLAGIGGVILTIGMAVDANILIFTRMQEELLSGKSLGQSVEDGFNRAWPAIRDGNATTLLVGFILLFLGTSFVKGFATTLNIGILLSMFSAIVVTRSFLRLFVGTRLEKITWLWK